MSHQYFSVKKAKRKDYTFLDMVILVSNGFKTNIHRLLQVFNVSIFIKYFLLNLQLNIMTDLFKLMLHFYFIWPFKTFTLKHHNVKLQLEHIKTECVLNLTGPPLCLLPSADATHLSHKTWSPAAAHSPLQCVKKLSGLLLALIHLSFLCVHVSTSLTVLRIMGALTSPCSQVLWR